MNLIADEGIDVPVVNYLRANGHHVLYILEDSPGMPDSDILQLAQDRNEVLLVYDKDFGELVYRMKQVHSGIILVRLSGMKPIEKAKIILDAINMHHTEMLEAFTVITKQQIKIRKQSLL